MQTKCGIYIGDGSPYGGPQGPQKGLYYHKMTLKYKLKDISLWVVKKLQAVFPSIHHGVQLCQVWINLTLQPLNFALNTRFFWLAESSVFGPQPERPGSLNYGY